MAKYLKNELKEEATDTEEVQREGLFKQGEDVIVIADPILVEGEAGEVAVAVIDKDEEDENSEQEKIDCVQCSNGHDAKLTYSDPYITRHESRGFICNGCKVQYYKCDDGVYHCDLCDWDLCADCVKDLA